MDNQYRFIVLGHPITQGSMRHVGKGRMLHSNPKLDAWRRTIAYTARKEYPGIAPWDGRVGLELCFSFTDKHAGRDIDKLARAVMDALTGIVYKDDQQVTVLHADKVIGDTEFVSIRAWQIA